MARARFDLLRDPFGTRAGFPRAASPEDEPDQPVANGSPLIFARPVRPESKELGAIPSWKFIPESLPLRGRQ